MQKPSFVQLSNGNLFERKNSFKINLGPTTTPVAPTRPLTGEQLDAELVQASARSEEPFVQPSPNLGPMGYYLATLENPWLTKARVALADRRPDEAIKLLLEALDHDGENPFLQCLTWGKLCEIYLSQQKTDDFRKAFAKYAHALSKIPSEAGLGASDNLAMLAGLYAEMNRGADPAALQTELERMKASSGKAVNLEEAKIGLQQLSQNLPEPGTGE